MIRKRLIIAFWVAFVLSGALYGAMLFLTLPQLLVGEAQLRPFDARPLGYSYDEAMTYLEELTDTARDVYLGLQHRLDRFFPLTNGVALALAVLIVIRQPVLRWTLLALVLGVTLCDYAENAAVAGMLEVEPMAVTPEQVEAANRYTVLKSAGTTIVWVALLIGLAVNWSRRT